MFSGIRHRLTLWYSGIFGLVLVLFGLSAYSFVRQALYQGIDEGSRQIAEGIHLALHRFGIALMGMSLLTLLLAFWVGRFLAMQAIKPIQTSFERRQRFTADASHELRTPLSVIQTQAEVLSARLPRTPQELSEALAPLLHASRRMSVMIGDLLFLARSDAATLELRPVRLDLDELTEQVLEEQALLAEAKGLKVEFSGTPNASTRWSPTCSTMPSSTPRRAPSASPSRRMPRPGRRG